MASCPTARLTITKAKSPHGQDLTVASVGFGARWQSDPTPPMCVPAPAQRPRRAAISEADHATKNAKNTSPPIQNAGIDSLAPEGIWLAATTRHAKKSINADKPVANAAAAAGLIEGLAPLPGELQFPEVDMLGGDESLSRGSKSSMPRGRAPAMTIIVPTNPALDMNPSGVPVPLKCEATLSGRPRPSQTTMTTLTARNNSATILGMRGSVTAQTLFEAYGGVHMLRPSVPWRESLPARSRLSPTAAFRYAKDLCELPGGFLFFPQPVFGGR